MENNSEVKFKNDFTQENKRDENLEQEYTPKLFSEDQNQDDDHARDSINENNNEEQLFDQDTSEDEDFEIPAFLRRQKF